MSVNSNKNKEVLFDVLTSVINENNLVVQIKTLQSLIDNQCNMYEQNKHQYKNLSEINKIILDNIYKFLTDNQKKTPSISVVKDNDLFNKNNFTKNFEIAKQNFDNMITLKKPNEINFEDEEDNALPPENLETIMNQTLADREKELESITQRYSNENKQQAQNWINKDNSQKENPNLQENNIDLIIDESSQNETKKITKKVTFKDISQKKTLSPKNQKDAIQSFNIFNKLKKKSNDIVAPNIEKKIDTIIVNQDIIMKQQNEILKLLNKSNLKTKLKSQDLQPL
tara:strand:- start:11666 stop:12517 length:852 start_codon:yes stop_codon:yes gene_type:complete